MVGSFGSKGFSGKAELQCGRRAKSALLYLKGAICNSIEISGFVLAFARMG